MCARTRPPPTTASQHSPPTHLCAGFSREAVEGILLSNEARRQLEQMLGPTLVHRVYDRHLGSDKCADARTLRRSPRRHSRASTHPRRRRCETLFSMLKARYALNPTKKQAAHGLHGVMEQTATLLADNATRKWAFNAHARGI